MFGEYHDPSGRFFNIIFETRGEEITLQASLITATDLSYDYKRKYLLHIRRQMVANRRYTQGYETADWLKIATRHIFTEHLLDTSHGAMPHLSFHAKDDGTPIARISEGEHKGEILFSYEGEGIGDKPGLQTLTLPKGSKFEVLPNPDPEKREVYYICGASGCGKSYFVKGLVELYRKLFPEREVYLCSHLESDDTLDSLRPPLKRVNIKSFVDRPPTLDEFQDCFLICDDIDSLPKDELKAIWNVIDTIAIQGRHTRTTLAVISHYITNYKTTRLILNEATKVVVYPQATSISSLRYMLERKFGIDVDKIKAFKRMKTRWVCLYAMYPQYYITETSAGILATDD